jgi:hypothetical protein
MTYLWPRSCACDVSTKVFAKAVDLVILCMKNVFGGFDPCGLPSGILEVVELVGGM